jgi:hypothetical protein
MSDTAPARAAAMLVKGQRRELRVELHNLGRGRAAERLADVLLAPPPFLAKMEVDQLLQMVPRVGRESALLLCAAAACSPTRRVGELTARQRDQIRGALRSIADNASAVA